jgi:hypothetical protein
MRGVAILIASIPLLAAGPAAAQDATGERPEALTRVLDCRAIADPQARLACFDREVAAMEAAEASRELVIVDRQQLRQTRRTLFGLTLPNLSIFGDGSGDEEASRIESTIQSVRQTPYRKYILTLEDGAVWHQIDSRTLPIEPRAGHSIRIRRAAMGSYLANVNDQVAIRVRRER